MLAPQGCAQHSFDSGCLLPQVGLKSPGGRDWVEHPSPCALSITPGAGEARPQQ